MVAVACLAMAVVIWVMLKPTDEETAERTETISHEKNKPGTTAEWRYYVSSHPVDNNKLASYVRNHWSIESEYHWELDVHLHDDADKKHDKIAATNFAKTKRLLLCLVKSKLPEGKKRSVRSRLKRVSWDLDYLLTLLLLKNVHEACH